MKAVHIYVAVTAAIAVLVVDMKLSCQTPTEASVEKTAQYQQNSLNQNLTGKPQV